MRRALLPLTLTFLTMLAGCDGGGDGVPVASEPPADTGTAVLELVHASPDAPDVRPVVALEPLAEVIPFKGAFATTVTSDNTRIEVRGVLPDGEATVIDPVGVSTPDGQRVTVLAIGEVAEIEPLVIRSEDVAVGEDEVRLRVVHAAPSAPMVDVYLTAPDTALADASPAGTAMFGGDFGPVSVAAGDYRIRVTAAGDADTVVFDSGTVPLAGGSDLIVSALDNTTTGDAPITLLVFDGSEATELLDTATPAEVRVVHASPDAPNVDVLVDGATPPAVVDLAYGDFTPYLELPPAEYGVQVTATGTTTPAVIDAALELEAGVQYSVYASGLLADIEPLVLVDDDRPVATEARLRVVHASPSAGAVDVYLVAAGTDLATVDPVLAGVTFPNESGYLSVAPGRYDVVVTAAGTTTAAIGPAPVMLEAGGVYTAAARDADGGGGPFGLILLDDF